MFDISLLTKLMQIVNKPTKTSPMLKDIYQFYNLLSPDHVPDLPDTLLTFNLGSMTRYLVISPVSTGQLQGEGAGTKIFYF